MDECIEHCVPGKMKQKSCCMSYDTPSDVLKGQLQGAGQYSQSQMIQIFPNTQGPKYTQKIIDSQCLLLASHFVRE